MSQNSAVPTDKTTFHRQIEPSMFESARFKLTIFYLAIILLFSLSLTTTTRLLAQREYEHSNVVQRGAFRGVITRIYGLPLPTPNDDVFDFQHQQEREVRTRLNEYMIAINIGALLVGGLVSYWYAGRTLKPIEDAHDAQKRFASDASHELRTPLTAIRAENEVFLRQKDFSKDEAKELIQSNLEEVDRLERLATNLLSLTQYESASLDLTAIDVKQVADEAIKQNDRIHPGVKIVNKTTSSKVIGHEESLTQLLCILLDNACKYGAGGTVVVSGIRTESGYQIDVRDHGPGIAEEDLPRVFDRLYRGDKARSNQISGHGLGLALARQIAKANSAVVSVSNHPKGGAVFTVTLNRPSK